jgi:uncharacterized protein YndB with AHSA1/START domain
MSTPPTGRRERRDGHDYVVFTRTFRAPVEDVWAAVTEPRRLERWVGTWTGDPTTGHVTFRMTAEGEDAPAEIQTIEVCDPPRRLVTCSASPAPDGSGRQVEWRLELDLVEDDGVTVLTFAQLLPDPGWAAEIGPGWDYYLDRLVAAEAGADVGAIDFGRDYYPASADHYRALFGA